MCIRDRHSVGRAAKLLQRFEGGVGSLRSVPDVLHAVRELMVDDQDENGSLHACVVPRRRIAR
eukprot:8812687-Alexandrium_andersonii.AAC.1